MKNKPCGIVPLCSGGGSVQLSLCLGTGSVRVLLCLGVGSVQVLLSLGRGSIRVPQCRRSVLRDHSRQQKLFNPLPQEAHLGACKLHPPFRPRPLRCVGGEQEGSGGGEIPRKSQRELAIPRNGRSGKGGEEERGSCVTPRRISVKPHLCVGRSVNLSPELRRVRRTRRTLSPVCL